MHYRSMLVNVKEYHTIATKQKIMIIKENVANYL